MTWKWPPKWAAIFSALQKATIRTQTPLKEGLAKNFKLDLPEIWHENTSLKFFLLLFLSRKRMGIPELRLAKGEERGYNSYVRGVPDKMKQ
ncbi:MAG: hypothetical protein HFF18_06945 [Oscillospiraceae bacterium]|nr:hypothetical protein [Oscillospiraceae bacterium]